MLRLTLCLLVARTAFAANAFPVDNTAYGPVGPNTNLVFNFEQIRRDQPPQIEMREENIHKYMNRPRTTTPIPIDNGDMTPMKPEHPIPYTAEQWSALQTAPKHDGPGDNWKNVPAPPSFPHWDSLAVNNQNNYNAYEHQRQPTYEHQRQPTYEQQRHPTYEHQRQPIVVEDTEWQEPEMHSRVMPTYTSTVAPVTYAPVSFAPVTLPPREPVTLPPRAPVTFAPRAPVTYAPREPVRMNSRSNASSRGSHRFNWSDVTTQASTTVAPVYAPTAANSRMPPPPVPTLSPWYDGF